MNINHKCTESVIRELCETRDSCIVFLIKAVLLLNVRNKYYIITIHIQLCQLR